MSMEGLRHVAARYALGIAQSSEVQQIADEALSSGIYSPSLVELVDSSPPIMSTIGPLFEAALAEISMEIPCENDAIKTLVRHHLETIVSGTARPRDGLARIMEDVVYPSNIVEKTKEVVGDSHGLETLIGAYYQYDELNEQLSREFESGKRGIFDGFRKLDRDVINAAKAWLSDESV